jgi:hypothetical protein
MRSKLAGWLALMAFGLAVGTALSLLVLSPGRFGTDVFAELYHGEIDTTGTVHVALDCDVLQSGTQSHCDFFASGFSMGVTVGNSTGAATSISAFNFRVTNNRQDLFDPAVGVDTNLDYNPDFNQSLAGGGQGGRARRRRPIATNSHFPESRFRSCRVQMHFPRPRFRCPTEPRTNVSRPLCTTGRAQLAHISSRYSRFPT